MGKTYEELMAELSPERRACVEARTVELIAEEQSLRDLRSLASSSTAFLVSSSEATCFCQRYGITWGRWVESWY
jgi:hypothetical protein